MSLVDRLRALPLQLLPQRLSSRLVYRLARVRTPWIKNPLIRAYIRLYRVAMDEAAEPDPRAYPDFNAFFTRALKPGARPVASEP
jgi:phosphatidylserine decarboxylase